MFSLTKSLTAAFGMMMLLATPALVQAQEDCHRGTLDVAYCDRNLDQLADLPTDPNDWVDPSTIIFTYTPVEDPAVYANIWQGFVDHMAAVTDRRVAFFPDSLLPSSKPHAVLAAFTLLASTQAPTLLLSAAPDLCPSA